MTSRVRLHWPLRRACTCCLHSSHHAGGSAVQTRPFLQSQCQNNATELLHTCGGRSAASMDVRGLPTMRTAADGGGAQVFAALLPQWLLLAAFTIYVGQAAHHQLRQQRGSLDKMQVGYGLTAHI